MNAFRTTFMYGKFRDSAFFGYYLEKCSLANSDLQNIYFRECTIIDTDFTEYKFDNVQFVKCSLDDVKFDKMVGEQPIIID